PAFPRGPADPGDRPPLADRRRHAPPRVRPGAARVQGGAAGGHGVPPPRLPGGGRTSVRGPRGAFGVKTLSAAPRENASQFEPGMSSAPLGAGGTHVRAAETG